MPEISLPNITTARRRTRTYDATAERLLNDITQAIEALLPPAGALVPTLLTNSPGDGWLICDGSAVSKEDFPRLYSALAGNVAETATTFDLPDLRNWIPMGAGAIVGLMATAGAAQTALTVAQLPPHSHNVNDPGHEHPFAGDPHTHGVTDPGHEHLSGSPAPAANTATGTDEAASVVDATSLAFTNVTVNPAVATGTVETSGSNITIANTGNGAPVDIVPPVFGVNWMVRT